MRLVRGGVLETVGPRARQRPTGHALQGQRSPLFSLWSSRMKEYRVLSQSDSFWKDRFSPGVLENELNAMGRKGWTVVAITTSEFTGLGGLGSKRHEMLV